MSIIWKNCIENGKITHLHNPELKYFRDKGNCQIEQFNLNKIFLPSYIFINYGKIFIKVRK